VSVVSFELPPGGYDDARTHALVTGLTAALRALSSGAPGVIDAFGFTSAEPSFLRRGFHTFFRLPGETPEQGKPIMFSDVSPGYFNVLQIPIVAGRDFEPADQGRPVALINEAMARQYWPHDNPIGKTFLKSGGGLIRRGAGSPPSEVREIIGVVKNAHTNSLYEFVPMFYQVLSAGRPVPKLVVRTSGPVPSGEIARVVQRLDSRVRTQTIALAATLEERMHETRTGPLLAAVLGACALASRDRRHVRRVFLRGAAAHARDRRPDGARRTAVGRGAACSRRPLMPSPPASASACSGRILCADAKPPARDQPFDRCRISASPPSSPSPVWPRATSPHGVRRASIPWSR
jgi:putative ABC transport system permease protein